MRLEENLPNLPNDLILNIFSRLRAKEVSRCRCLSKLWASLLTARSPHFTGLFLAHSNTRPRLIFSLRTENNEWCLYSCPQPKISPTKVVSSISVAAEFCMHLPESDSFMHISPSISGLMYFFDRPDLNNPTVCNPTTGHILSLPQLGKTMQSYFGYDPINNHFTVLAICHHGTTPGPGFLGFPSRFQMLKLGPGSLCWSSLKCPIQHCPYELHVCINGILYYMASILSIPPFRIITFDLNSQEFSIIDQPCESWYPDLLVNWKGKLGALYAKWVGFPKKRSYIEVSLWVLEDANKKEWSKQVFDIVPPKRWSKKREAYRIIGLTGVGEIVFTSHYITPPLHIYFFNIEVGFLREVVIRGCHFLKPHKFYGCVDFVEQLRAPEWNDS